MTDDIIGPKLRRSLALGIASVMVAVIGLIMLMLGLCNGKTPLIVAGGAILFVCFYLIPISWIHYSGQKNRMRIIRIITERDRTPVSLVASSLAIGEEEALSRITDCLSAGLIPGYALSDGTVVRTKFIDPEQVEKTMKCTYCNATFSYKGNDAKCPYCGTVFHGGQ